MSNMVWWHGVMDNMLYPINEAALLQARLASKWVIVCTLRAGKPPRYITSHPDQLSLPSLQAW